MQKIMFNDKYGLTEAVLKGRKTMTRRMESGMENLEEGNFCFLKGKKEIELYGEKGTIIETIKPRYKVGEIVAVAQSYHALNEAGYVAPEWLEHTCESSAGYKNKMFVRADLMPHQIQITDIKMERLQDISEADCMKEGIICNFNDDNTHGWHWNPDALPFDETFCSPREAFVNLIDKVSGKGTWDSNPYVFAYTFELVD